MLNINNHPHEIFEEWYLQSLGKSKQQNLMHNLKIKSQELLKNMFTQVVPSLDRMNQNAFVLATASKEGAPSSRVVLLKGQSEKGYIFYTNYNSSKSDDLISNPVASLNFFWAYPTRQVRIVGEVSKLSYEQSSKYWQSRPRGSQEGAMASNQSEKISSYSDLEDSLKAIYKTYKGKDIPCPQHWGGFIVAPTSYEFWQAMPNRLHKRTMFKLNPQGTWEKSFLAP